MLNWQPDSRPHDRTRATALLAGNVNRFLVESEQRVIAHCRAMLRRDDLEADEQQRLAKLLDDADLRLRRLLVAAA